VFSAYREHVAEMGPYIGLSHYVWGESKPGEAEGKKGDIITRIVAARSVDFVTVPGRGGAIAEAFRAARPPEPTDEQKAAGESSMGETTPTPKLTLESLRKEHPEIIEALRTEIENSAAMKEAQAQQEKKLAETEKALEEAKTENARLKEALLLVEARTFVEAKVKASTLPEISKTRLPRRSRRTRSSRTARSTRRPTPRRSRPPSRARPSISRISAPVRSPGWARALLPGRPRRSKRLTKNSSPGLCGSA